MIIRTPFRITLFGGGTDFPEYFTKKRKDVDIINAAIDKYCYVEVLDNLSNDCNFEIVGKEIERCDKVEDIKNPLVRNALQVYCPDIDKLKIIYTADLDGKSGLGTSSSYAVSLVKAFSTKAKIPNCLASEAIKLEREIMQEKGGWQDQIIAAHGGLLITTFKERGSFFSTKKIDAESSKCKKLSENLLMFDTGLRRFSKDVQEETDITRKDNNEVLNKIREISSQAKNVLINNSGKLSEIGILLDMQWELKKKLSRGISNDTVDKMYELAKNAGALGGKLMGAGKGGFLLLYVEENKQEVREALKDYKEVEFNIVNDRASIICK